ncbi:MAG: hypothetical protein U5L96_00990 [Owenweeksia sp.]|nr:hypothetical protein [Owenweeksia sp.]
MEICHHKRPFLNAYGISMAYHREQGLKEGYISDTRRGNDGRMCFDLMKYGKVRRLRSYSANVWTGTCTLFRDGSFAKAFWRRVMIHISRFDEYFKKATRPRYKNLRKWRWVRRGQLAKIEEKSAYSLLKSTPLQMKRNK